MPKGTALDSIGRLANLRKGYPTKDPKSGKVTVSKKPPQTKTNPPKPKAKPKSDQKNTFQDRRDQERKTGAVNRTRTRPY